jgi:N-hydroxyarylamine O-acetyltransferase
MDITSYLNRITYQGKPQPNMDTLFKLHRLHVMNVPFENLDIHLGREIKIDCSYVYNKVVVESRGGFCYELNYLFNWLLKALGYTCEIISARIYNAQGQPGPLYDHMCLLVDLGEKYIADVGFGDLLLQPVKIRPGVQSDGRNHFIIEQLSDKEYQLSMSSNREAFEKKYIFSTQPEPMHHFEHQCYLKQYSEDSYFVKNKICTRPTPEGRETIYNNKFIVTKGRERTWRIIDEGESLSEILRTRFNITLPTHPSLLFQVPERRAS